MRDKAGKPARTTLRMVAELAGVSTATVSYVLSGRTGGRTGVSEATMARVRLAAQELNYHPNQAARAIRTGKTNLVLLSLTMLSDPWAQEVGRAVSAAVTPAGLTALILADGDWATAITRQPCDVAFIDSARTADQREVLRRLARSGYRLVVFDDELEPDGFDVIRSEATEGCRLAVRHLLESHDRIGCLTTRMGRNLEHRRYAVYLEELEAAGIAHREDYVETIDLDPTSAYAAAVRMLSSPDRPTAIYAISDFAAMSAVQAALRLRLRVPEDVAIIGVGNTVEGERMEPSLSSVGPTDFFTRLAEILRDRATGEQPGSGTLYDFSWSLFARETTLGQPVGSALPSNSTTNHSRSHRTES
ncbi:LacI family DNA-binding transcriptional regulator [Microlunatus sp. Gsoil 973]|uniref:LacI family DNA-binding transcriptional regulator n=1 Tax=Microlunatus sp. Gsoil 973 TaxID=2672569 RepID=UPI001E57B618|nr:LacI family DNA-binding transcriptional regulator [Microlunatus sp. Gsoil 973]